MLIIFDLDDTLIDTSGSVTPYKMQCCLEQLIQEGLPVADFAAAYQELLAINAQTYRSKDALTRFVERYGGSPALVETTLKELTTPLPAHFPISTTPNAKKILVELSQNHSLALVTGGYPPFQRQKMEKAGIEPTFFSKIAIPEDSCKRPHYEALLKQSDRSPEEILVCGDRIQMDLAPARELGFTTVHMRWGRGLTHQTEAWVDYAIEDLCELRKIVK